MHKARRHPTGQRVCGPQADRSKQGGGPIGCIGQLGVKRLDAPIQEPLHRDAVPLPGEALKATIAHTRPLHANQHAGPGWRGLVVALQLLARLDDAEDAAGGHAAGLQQRGGQDLPHGTLQGQPAIATAGPGSAARALGGQVQQAAGAGLPKLGEEEAPPIAKIWVVTLELVAMVAQGQGLAGLAGQGSEAREGVDQLPGVQAVEAQVGRGRVVAKAQQRHGKGRRTHLVPEGGPHGVWVAGVGLVGGSNRHGPAYLLLPDAVHPQLS